MAGKHVEFPGYYYDSERNRYFKKGPNYSSPKKTETGTTQPSSSRFYNLVHHLRRRTTQLEPSHVSNRITEELLVPFYHENREHSIELTIALQQIVTSAHRPINQHHTIKDIKIDESGRYLSVSVHYQNKYEITPTCGRRDFLLLLNMLPSGKLEVKSLNYGSTIYKSMASCKTYFSGYFHAKGSVGDSSDVDDSTTTVFIPEFITSKGEVNHGPISIKANSAICCDRHGNVIIGTYRGECVFIESQEKVTLGKTEVSAIAAMRKSPLVCAGLKNGKLVVIDQRTKHKHQIDPVNNIRSKSTRSTTSIISLHPLHNDDKIVVVSKNRLELWDVLSCNRIHQFKIQPSHLTVMDENRIVIDSKDLYLMVTDYRRGSIHIWSITSGHPLYMLRCHDVNVDHSHGEQDGYPTSVCHTHSLGGCHGYPAMIVSRDFDFLVYRPIIS